MSSLAHTYGIYRFGGPSVICSHSSPLAPLAAGQLRLQVLSAGINPIDLKTRAGLGFVAASKAPEAFLPLGYDVYGEVIAASDELSALVGQHAFGMVGFAKQPGAYSDFLTVARDEVICLPAMNGDVALGGLSLAGLTALQALALIPTQLPLYINAATGGVGHLAVQLAVLQGREVIALTTKLDDAWLANTQQRLAFKVMSYDYFFATRRGGALLDLIGLEMGARCVLNMNEGAVVVTVPTISAADITLQAKAQHIQCVGVVVKPDLAQLAAIYDYVEAQQLQLRVAKSFPLDEVAAAHEWMEHTTYSGKVLLIAKN
ncbi:zinc-binding dehydrogenase [Pseudoalteromonas fenneropenaei]|uniref:Zinc-binding dehydrogenase n=1 Tax=Pseudoalteromonas fenneropenaei TaxID=1737459 RepID=A0ABV7CN99_9GAMM